MKHLKRALYGMGVASACVILFVVTIMLVHLLETLEGPGFFAALAGLTLAGGALISVLAGIASDNHKDRDAAERITPASDSPPPNYPPKPKGRAKVTIPGSKAAAEFCGTHDECDGCPADTPVSEEQLAARKVTIRPSAACDSVEENNDD